MKFSRRHLFAGGISLAGVLGALSLTKHFLAEAATAAITPAGQTIWLQTTNNNQYISTRTDQTNSPLEAIATQVQGWEEYDVRTGQSYFRPGVVRVRSYPVDVAAGGEIARDEVGVAADVTAIEGAATRTSGLSALRRGPYVAETYPVAVDGRYVVVEIDDQAP